MFVYFGFIGTEKRFVRQFNAFIRYSKRKKIQFTHDFLYIVDFFTDGNIKLVILYNVKSKLNLSVAAWDGSSRYGQVNVKF